VVRGAPRGPVRDLDALPPAAYDLLYEARPEYGRTPNKAFLATRGCPYRCTYCFNRTLNERHRPYGRLVRTRDPERIVDEILHVRDRWGVALVWFLDANFTADVRWLEAFAAAYRRRVGLPFMCKLRPERATERVVRTLVGANCTAVGIGLESGSERLRREWLGRPVGDADILAGCRRLKAAGLRVLAFNMLGIPGETLDEALRTVAFNVACGVDFGAATILQPYPGTALAARAIAAGEFDGDFDRLDYSYFGDSPFAFPSPRARHRITNLQRLFSYAVEFPEVRRRLRWLIDRPPSRLYWHLFEVRHGWAMRRTFYQAESRFPPRDAGTTAHLAAACRELGLAPPAA
jgi:pyruvate-formate lyase-activating enzyme